MCVGKAVDNLLPSPQPYAPGALKNWIPSAGEALDPHYMRTSGYEGKAEKRHDSIGVHQPEIPDPPPPIPLPQSSQTPDTGSLKRRNNTGGFATPSGSTLLTGPSGITRAQLNLGAASLLGS
jgi:hypothetical protein